MLVGKFKNAIIKFNNYVECYKNRKKLKNTDFTIISNNCWGGKNISEIWYQILFPNNRAIYLGTRFCEILFRL